MNLFEKQNGSLVFRSDGELLMITPWGKNSFRVRSRIMGDMSEENAALLTQPSVNTDIIINEEQASITNGNLQAVVKGSNGKITFYGHDGKLLLQESLNLKARHFKHISGGSSKLKVNFEASSDEKIYGMGQYQQEILDLKGCSLELYHHNTQTSVPFYISSIGYGFLWNNPAIGEVHFSKNVTQWVAESTHQMDYWITAGQTPAEIEEAYASVTGTAPMMPEYGLGFWQCKLRYYSQEQVLSVAREYKKKCPY